MPKQPANERQRGPAVFLCVSVEAIRNEAFQSPNGNGFVDFGSPTGRFARGAANSSTNGRQRIGTASNQVGVFKPPLGNGPNVPPRIRVDRTCILALDLPLPVLRRWDFDLVTLHGKIYQVRSLFVDPLRRVPEYPDNSLSSSAQGKIQLGRLVRGDRNLGRLGPKFLWLKVPRSDRIFTWRHVFDLVRPILAHNSEKRVLQDDDMAFHFRMHVTLQNNSAFLIEGIFSHSPFAPCAKVSSLVRPVLAFGPEDIVQNGIAVEKANGCSFDNR